MKHKTLFRLLIKFLGVWLIANGIVSLTNTLGQLLRYSIIETSSTVTSFYWVSFAGGVTGVLLGLYLFFGGKRIVDLAIPSNRPYCHECGYDLTGAVGNVCNECGTAFRGAPVAGQEGISHG